MNWCDVLQFIVHIVQLFILLPTGAVDTSTDYRDLASCSERLHNDNSILQPPATLNMLKLAGEITDFSLILHLLFIAYQLGYHLWYNS